MNRKFKEKELVLATHNLGKIEEFKHLFGDVGFKITDIGQYSWIPPEESGKAFWENSLIKAREATKLTGMVSLADDSGLCATALDGKPGVYTADWAERQWFEGAPGRDWYFAKGKIVGMLSRKGPNVVRHAKFVCTLAIAWPDGSEIVYEGFCNGNLTWPPRGDKGFGYDPVFIPEGLEVTFGEMDPEEKHKISHRASAFKKLVNDQFC